MAVRRTSQKRARNACGSANAPVGLKRDFWKYASAIRRIFREAFECAGLPYYNPHSFRKTLARLALQVCGTPEEMKAWSQNLGHDHALTTFTSYATIETSRQAEIMERLRNQPDAPPASAVDETAMVAMEAEKVQKILDRLGIE